ncbi:ABC transporter permease [Alkalihalophilus marmarensis]|uniref:ABC transporter permease n=1 Tax=Alkalihalophilus marmarensis TaxID=521377 RepID=UPI002DB9AB54|nr:ABC transporter permease [Alkalihalophilus marmarensis]MEC2072615.1 ABC transporter permease [Alkalihalophilus marmarensis]
MKSVFLLQWQRFRRSPMLVLSFFVLTIIFVAFIAGFSSGDQKLTVSTFADDTLTEEEKEAWITTLNESDAYEFVWVDEVAAKQSVSLGEESIALKLLPNDYRLVVATEDPSRFAIEAYLQKVYREELRLQQLDASFENKEIRSDVIEYMQEPALQVKTSALGGDQSSSNQFEQVHALVGMTLFFVIYTIIYSLMNVVDEKQLGTWDRLIISPVKKWQVYLGHLAFSFVIGYLQIILIFILFIFGFGFDLGDRIGTILFVIACYTFTIVAVGILLIGLSKSSQQLNAIIPIVASGMAMLGGAYWPIEAVTNDILLTLSKGMPILYGMEALKGAALYDRGIVALAEPISILLLIGVLCMGVGMNLMERRG